MTDAEAKERAQRIVSLQLPDVLLASEMAREFQQIATECGWQKELLKNYQTHARDLSAHLGRIINAASLRTEEDDGN